jgi:phosphate transport system permease protein
VSSTLESAPSGGPPASGRRAAAARSASRRNLADRLATRFVTLSGLLIIAAILAILFVIVGVAWPLLRPPSATSVPAGALPAGTFPLALAVDEYREEAFVATKSGLLVLPVAGGRATATDLPGLGEATVVKAVAPEPELIVLGLSDGRLYPVAVSTEVAYDEGKRRVTPSIRPGTPVIVDPSGKPAGVFKYVRGPDGPIALVATGPRELTLVRVVEKTSLMGEATKEESRVVLPVTASGEVTSLALDVRGQDIFAGTSTGEIVRFDLRDEQNPKQEETVAASAPGTAVTVLGFLNGDRTLVSGDTAGRVSSWQVIQAEEGGSRRLARIHEFQSHGAAVTGFSASRRDKGFVTGDAAGGVEVHYSTTGKTLLTLVAGKAPLGAVVFAPKADAVLAASLDGELHQFTLRNPHPEVSWQSLFGKVWYEGYAQPDYVWQSTGGTDDFEAKLSLTPLIYGTLKGTFYALILAIPLALAGALYTSQFMHPDLRSVVKPVVEVMAALPSVVLGFIAGLWLAPQVEKIVPGILLMPVVIPLLAVLAAAAWAKTPARVRTRIPNGWEAVLLVPLVVGGGALSIWLGFQVERFLLAGDYRHFLLTALGLTYDQRNSLVVGISMGFAVIPIIFTVAEDSLSSVPAGLTAGSLALGATRWQTALRTVLPTASPGIFSAVMIGFGRAVGETMIVLMATGNTPVMDASIFNGFRALSANIAVELPEAPEGGTLFRVLFLAALLLFLMTFVVNTAAELVRLRLRKKYRTFE